MTTYCHVCGSECEGTTGAVIDGKFRPMCHEGPDPTCYQRWSWSAGSRVDKMIANPERYFAECMARHLADIKSEREAKRRLRQRPRIARWPLRFPIRLRRVK